MLEAIQTSFFKSIFQDNHNGLDFISSPYPSERLNIYRQTIFENMANALSITFPGIWKLLGEECANSVAYAYCRIAINLPTSGCLDYFGEAFPDFLANQKELKNLPYLKDYALYECLKHQAYGAKDFPTIKPSDLESVPENQIEAITFSFIPSVFTFVSNLPIDEIEKVANDPQALAINLSTTKVYAIIARPPHDKVLTFWISESLWHFIRLLQQELNLSQASDQTRAHYPDFDLAQAIHFLLQKQLIHQIIFL